MKLEGMGKRDEINSGAVTHLGDLWEAETWAN